ncbi:MAG: hypothetical protein CMP24_01495 [Rickettsiales bacterium]|nr:hypothetical protein [Rickettsiales bacterium]
MIINKKIFLLLILSNFLISNLTYSENINICIKKAVEKGIELNKILTLCKDNIKNIEVYSNTYEENNNEKKSSEYISTNKTDKIIHEMIEKGNLAQAGRLAERLEKEKTNRIKARAEAEALRSPQIIATTSTKENKSSDASNVRSIISLGTDPIKSISAGSKILEVTTPGTHGAVAGQFVTLVDVNSSVDGIAASEINSRHIISSVPTTTTFRIAVLSSALAGAVAGGGSSIIATFEN